MVSVVVVVVEVVVLVADTVVKRTSHRIPAVCFSFVFTHVGLNTEIALISDIGYCWCIDDMDDEYNLKITVLEKPIERSAIVFLQEQFAK